LDAWFLIMAEGFHEHDLPAFLNQINSEIQARLDRGELPFRLRARVRLTEKVSAVLYEREAPWSSYPPGAAAPPPSHALTADFDGGVRFLGYDWKRRNDYLGEISYYWTVPRPVPEDYRVHVELDYNSQVFLRQDHRIAGGRYPFFRWRAEEIVKQTMTVYAPPGRRLEARLWLTGWGGVKSPTVVHLRLEE
jgi:hypothetical protein